MWPLSERERPKAPPAESQLEERLTELLQAAEIRMVKRLESRLDDMVETLKVGIEDSIKKAMESPEEASFARHSSPSARVGERPAISQESGSSSMASPKGPYVQTEDRATSPDGRSVNIVDSPGRLSQAGRRSRRWRNSAGGELPTGRAEEVWALVEADTKITSMLSEVRKQIDGNADKAEVRDARREGKAAAEGGKGGKPKISRRVHQPDGATVCHWLCGPVLHPDARFRMFWNVFLSAFICYCGIAVPLEIAFEQDMVQDM